MEHPTHGRLTHDNASFASHTLDQFAQGQVRLFFQPLPYVLSACLINAYVWTSFASLGNQFPHR
jgi:hypothetical protein